MRNRLDDERGLAGGILVGVVAWAFVAVACLVTILMTANHIDERVAFIRGQVSPIDNNLDSVKLLESINARADAINAAAAPLSGQLGVVKGHTDSILGEAAAIDDTAKTINTTVHSIEGSIAAIDSTAKAIRGDHNANGLGSGLAGAARRLDVLLGQITGIKADTGNILALVGSIQNTAKHIDNNMP
jgi:DNA-binding FrmR family transcriptional regulator